jgi:hypothetical protein
MVPTVARLLVKFVIEVDRGRAKLLNLEIMTGDKIHDEMGRLSIANPHAYGVFCHHEKVKYRTGNVTTHYRYLNSQGWMPPVAQIFTILEEAGADAVATYRPHYSE